jgi:MoxR-like ATPase
MQKMTSVLVYGPQGCGKTQNAKRLARHFGVSIIIDGEGLPDRLLKTQDALFLTNSLPGQVPAWSSAYPCSVCPL